MVGPRAGAEPDHDSFHAGFAQRAAWKYHHCHDSTAAAEPAINAASSGSASIQLPASYQFTDALTIYMPSMPSSFQRSRSWTSDCGRGPHWKSSSPSNVNATSFGMRSEERRVGKEG